MQRKHLYFLIYLVLIPSISSVAQVKEKLTLIEALSRVETIFDCSFSYTDEVDDNHYLYYEKPTTLDRSLESLRTNTLFDFTLVSPNKIAVSLKSKAKKYCLEVKDPFQDKLLSGVIINTSFQQLQTGVDGRAEVWLDPSISKIKVGGLLTNSKEISVKNLAATSCNRIRLYAEIEQLTPIFLTQYITQGIEKETDGTIRINTEDFVVLPGLIEKDVLFSLQALPGIQSVNENVSYLNIRGGTNDQNLMRWDGIKMYQNGHFFGLISAFNPSLTNKVNVIRNGTRASLGDGVSGTIELFTDDELTSTFTSEVGINMISADAFFDIPITNKASIQVAGRKSLNNIWSSPTYNAYFDKAFQNTEISRSFESGQTEEPNFSFYDAGMRLLWTPTQKDKIRLNVLSYQNELNFSERDTNQPQFDTRTLNSGLTQQSLVGGFSHSRNWSDTFKTELQVYATQYELGATNADLANEQTLEQKNTIEEGGIFLEASYRLLDYASLTFGYEFVETGITNLQNIDNPLFFREEKNVMLRNSGFASLHVTSKNKKTNLDLGVRGVHYDKFNTARIEPRLSLSHRFLKYFAVELLGELKSQNTSQVIDLQRDFLGVENRRWLLSEPGSIPLLESRQSSIGLSYSNKGLLINIEPYLKKVDGITSQSQGFQNQFENVRDTGSYTVKGVDVLLNKNFNLATVWLSYSYADNRYTFDTLNPSVFHNNLDITHTLTAGGNYKWKQFDFAAGLNWHTGKPFTLPNRDQPKADGMINYSFPNEARIKDYIRVDTSILYTFKISKKIKAMAGISFWNLLNRENHIRSFFTLDEEQTINQINDRALPFTTNAAFRVFF